MVGLSQAIRKRIFDTSAAAGKNCAAISKSLPQKPRMLPIGAPTPMSKGRTATPVAPRSRGAVHALQDPSLSVPWRSPIASMAKLRALEVVANVSVV